MNPYDVSPPSPPPGWGFPARHISPPRTEERDAISENKADVQKLEQKSPQDFHRGFSQPVGNDDIRLDFYMMYKKEATEHDAGYVKKYDEDLNTTLIFAGLFSAVSSAFVIDIQSKLQPDPNEQAVALLHAILLTLNNSNVPNAVPVPLPATKNPPSEIIVITGLIYASLLISLLAAFIAMLGKQWVSRYLRNTGGSVIERCGDRQRKFDGLKKWPFHFFIESLPLMLQVSLFLLACGLSRYMWSINSSVSYVLIVLTTLGGLFYVIIVIIGTSSYECPFQTPLSSGLRNLWGRFGHTIISALHITIATSSSLCQILLCVGSCLWKLTAQNLTQWCKQDIAHLPPPLPSPDRPPPPDNPPTQPLPIVYPPSPVNHLPVPYPLPAVDLPGSPVDCQPSPSPNLPIPHPLPPAYLTQQSVHSLPVSHLPVLSPLPTAYLPELSTHNPQSPVNHNPVPYPLPKILQPSSSTPLEQILEVSSSLEASYHQSQETSPQQSPVPSHSALSQEYIHPLPHSPPSTSWAKSWLGSTTQGILHKRNTNDVRCVSWVLWNITDPEVLDTAIRLAGILRWFEDGQGIEPPYDRIVSTLKGCLDFNGQVYPTLRDRAYHSAQAILWIHICAMCKSREYAQKFPLPSIYAGSILGDDDLHHLLQTFSYGYTPFIIAWMYQILPGFSLLYLQWISNALLHLSWAMQNEPAMFNQVYGGSLGTVQGPIPLDTMLNRLLTSSILLGNPIDKEALEIQDKFDYFNHILSQFSQNMIKAIQTSHPQCKLLEGVLTGLSNLEKTNHHLTAIAYEWCSVICENYPTLTNGKDLLLLSLRIGFRNLDLKDNLMELSHTQYHKEMAKIILNSGDGEAIADLLHAWTSQSIFAQPYSLLSMCVKYLVNHRHPQSFSPRLRQLVIRCIELIGYKGFEEVGIKKYVRLLNELHVTATDIGDRVQWIKLLLDTIESPEGFQYLSSQYWKLLVELAISISWKLSTKDYIPHIIPSLKATREWNKLKCWVGVIGKLWPPEEGQTTKEELVDVMALLFQQDPHAMKELGTWIQQMQHSLASCHYISPFDPIVGYQLQGGSPASQLNLKHEASFQEIYKGVCFKVTQQGVI